MAENIITIDGRQLEFEKEETIVEVARRTGIFIPTLCHMKGTRPTGACRVCVVEVEGARALSPPTGLRTGPHSSSMWRTMTREQTSALPIAPAIYRPTHINIRWIPPVL